MSEDLRSHLIAELCVKCPAYKALDVKLSRFSRLT